ncbi:MAG TPA: hypothetical protein VGO79_00080, partial [Thermoanaerobaculia bacterium]
MTRRWRRSLAVAVGLIAGVCSSAVARAPGPDDFNYQRLQEGRMAFQQKRFGEAINQFRVAAFGSLDEPTLLTECLVRLAVSQAAAGKTADADETLARFVDVEKRFGAYGRASLEPDIRNDFQALLKKRVAPATLAGVPSLLVSEPASPGKAAKATAPAPAPATSKAPKASPPPTPAPAASASASGSTKSSPKASAPTPGEPYVSTADRSHQAMVEGRRLINASHAGEAERVLSQALAADPANRELRLT